MDIESLVFNSENAHYTKLQTTVDQLFEHIEDAVAKNSFKQELTSSEWKEMVDLCRNFTMNKYRITADDFRNPRIISRTKIIKLLWQYSKGLIDRLFELLWKNILIVAFDYDKIYKMDPSNINDKPSDPSNKYKYHKGESLTFLIHWKKFLIHWENGLNLLEPITKYTYLNYPKLLNKEISNDKTFTDFTNKYLMDRLISHLDEQEDFDLHKFLSLFIIELDTVPVQIFLKQKGIFNDTPLRLAFKYNYPVLITDKDNNDTTKECNIKDFYLSTMERNLMYHNFEILDFPKCVFEKMEQLAYISSVISPTLVEPMNESFVTKIFMNKYYITSYFQTFLEKEEPPTHNRSYISLIRKAYHYRNLDEEFDDLILKNIMNAFHKKFTVDSDFNEIIVAILKMQNLIDIWQPKAYENYFLKSVIRFFGSETKFWEKYSKFVLEILGSEDYEDKVFDFFRLRDCFRSTPIMKDVFNRVYFRKLLFNVEKFIVKRTLTDEKLLLLLLPHYAESSNYLEEKFKKLQEDIKDNIKSIITYRKNEDETDSEPNIISQDERSIINPLIFKKDNVPDAFHMDTENDQIKLPNVLQSKWDHYLNNCSIVNMTDTSKKITPVYNLQHCEIESPYRLSNGELLTFELTVYQTVILCEFNDNENVNFPNLLKKYQLSGKMLKDVLNSFLNIKLIKINKDKSFSLNEQYVPDETKIKKGKLLVRMPKLTMPTTSNPTSHDSNSTVSTNLDSEGSMSTWQRELICVHIMKYVKPERLGVTQEQIIRRIQDVMVGTSVGECKEALNRLVGDKYVDKRNDRYFYI